MRILLFILLLSAFLIAQDLQTPDSSDTVSASAPREISAPTNLTELNSISSDFSPFVVPDGRTVYFSSSREGGVGGEDIFFSIWEKGRWTAPRDMGRPINSKYNEGTMCLSSDGSELFLTICGGPDSYGGCDIYICTKKGEIWNEPRNLGKAVNSTWWDGHPCLSPSGDTLYFASDKFGGFGGLDIYYTYQTPKGWSKPVNLGYPINNARDQTSPFLHIDGRTLYFSSAGHGGLGGLDVMMSRLDTTSNKWGTPLNIGPPVNTSGNDYFFSVPGSGDFIYFASDRVGGYGGFDIYSFPLEEWQRPQVVATLVGKVVDAETELPLVAQVKIERLSDGLIIQDLQTDSVTGPFFAVLRAGETYGISVTAPGYAFASENYEVKPQEGYNELSHTFKLSKIQIGAIVELVNLFFDFAKWELRKESEGELKRIAKLMKEYPDMKIEVQGYADSTGGSEFNQKLSTFRAKAVHDWLMWNGTDKSRIAYKGFGEEEQGASEEELQKSRRVQFKILGLGEDSLQKPISPTIQDTAKNPAPSETTQTQIKSEMKTEPSDTIPSLEELQKLLEKVNLDSLADTLFMQYIVSNQEYRFGELERKPIAVKTAALGYPQIARDRGIQGIVLLKFDIDTTGKVVEGSAEIVKAMPKEIFDGAALEAIYHWRYTPALISGKRVSTKWLQPIIFRIE